MGQEQDKLSFANLKECLTEQISLRIQKQFKQLDAANTLYYNFSTNPKSTITYNKRVVLRELFQLYERHKHNAPFIKSTLGRTIQLQLNHPVTREKTLSQLRLYSTSAPHFIVNMSHVPLLATQLKSERYYRTFELLKALPDEYDNQGGGDRQEQVNKIKQLISKLERSDDHGRPTAERTLISTVYDMYKSIKDYVSFLARGSFLKSQLKYVLGQHFDIDEQSSDFDRNLKKAMETFQQSLLRTPSTCHSCEHAEHFNAKHIHQPIRAKG